eukprot:TRINITY_DN8382_c0_g1_i1.p1 TRINITY_DN8382_c0_g1~~TRINITY_DN8382_c0_g1_i1.p1  ORF type:complete len:541 (+),score=100.93 TRINITY_DN8382_c0_g1_i1:117-1625(+)
MCSYNEINGIPACANIELLTDIARNTWNFTGYIVGDCGAVGNIYSAHHFTNSIEEAVALSKLSGTDWDCGGNSAWYRSAISKGIMSESQLDVALSRFLTVQMELGVFDDPYKVSYKSLGMSDIDTPEHRKLAREASRQDVILLENKNNILPLKITTSTVLAIIGPNANNSANLLGDYSPVPTYTITPLQAFSERVSSNNLKFSEGCKDAHCTDTSGFAEAVSIAQKADVAILFLGTDTSIEAEGTDRADITLPGNQENLAKLIVQTKVPTIIVYISGAALSSPWISSNAQALLQVFFPGQEGGHGIVDVLTGVYNPAGRLPVTIYSSISQVPPMTDYNMSATVSTFGRTYKYFTAEPLYPFGFGRSFTQFQYSDLKLSSVSVTPCQSLTISINVQNIGDTDGSEVVQIYAKNTITSVPVPLIELSGFERVFLKSKENVTLSFTLSPRQMSVVREFDYQRVIEPVKQFLVYAGGCQPNQKLCSSNVLQSQFSIIGNVVPLSQC